MHHRTMIQLTNSCAPPSTSPPPLKQRFGSSKASQGERPVTPYWLNSLVEFVVAHYLLCSSLIEIWDPSMDDRHKTTGRVMKWGVHACRLSYLVFLKVEDCLCVYKRNNEFWAQANRSIKSVRW